MRTVENQENFIEPELVVEETVEEVTEAHGCYNYGGSGSRDYNIRGWKFCKVAKPATRLYSFFILASHSTFVAIKRTVLLFEIMSSKVVKRG
jgi:hypothetical protein